MMEKRRLRLTAALAAVALMGGIGMAGAQQAGRSAQQDVQTQQNTGGAGSNSQTQSSAQSGQSGQSQAASVNLDRGQIREVQRALDQKGVKAGRADGIMGRETESALRSFQQREGLQATGQINQQTLAKLGLNDLARSPTVGQGGQSTPAHSQAQSSNRSGGNNSANNANSTFIRDAIQGDLSEIEVGKLAQQKGTTDKVKQFGQKLTSDHSANLDKAKSLAQSMGATVPNQPNSEQKAMYDKLSKLSGSQFDRQFAQAMVEDHQKDVMKFQQESQGSGPVVDFAKETLPTLREHLQIAQSLTGSSSTTGSAAH
jgi:putative membrane protein